MTDDWEYEDEEEEEDEDGGWSAPWEGGEDPDVGDLIRGAAWGWLAMLPLLISYEIGVAMTGGNWHNTSELALFAVLRPFGPNAGYARMLLLAGLTLAAAGYCLRRHWGLVPLLLRTAAEGLVAAVILGPALIFVIGATGDMLPPLPPLGLEPGDRPGLGPALLLFGGAAYEELLFRLGLYGAFYVIFAVLLRGLGSGDGLRRWGAEVLALAGSSLAFAAFHLDWAVTWMGVGGEPFHPAVFTYRVLAGMLLGLLFRWRGPGTAAWTHGLFNLALLLGAGPDVFR